MLQWKGWVVLLWEDSDLAIYIPPGKGNLGSGTQYSLCYCLILQEAGKTSPYVLYVICCVWWPAIPARDLEKWAEASQSPEGGERQLRSTALESVVLHGPSALHTRSVKETLHLMGCPGRKVHCIHSLIIQLCLTSASSLPLLWHHCIFISCGF